MGKYSLEEKLAIRGEVEALIHGEPPMSIRGACARVAQDRGIPERTVTHQYYNEPEPSMVEELRTIRKELRALREDVLAIWILLGGERPNGR